MTRQLHLNAFFWDTGHHEAAWRLPESDPHAATSAAHFRHLARVAEDGRFDAVFFADSPSLGDIGRRPAASLDPALLLTTIAAETHHIGLIATASTSYEHPYNLARRFASLDHLSAGRVGWNIVTTASPEAAANFGLDRQPAHTDRYARAREFVAVTKKLWDSWDDTAVLGDKDQGVWGDDARVYPPAHRGLHYSVAGALNVPRSPQAYPVLVQAGSSPDGRDFAARHAEVIFTAQQTLSEARDFYADIKARAVAAGRDPDQVKVLPGLVTVLGDTETAARQRERELDELIVAEYGRAQLAAQLRVPVQALRLDEPLPAGIPAVSSVQGNRSRYQLIVELAQREALTVRQLITRLGGGRGHRTFAGTPQQTADTITEWFTTGAADGFNIMPAVLPSGLEEFSAQVLPILRDRGLFRREYSGTTLRDHYGLTRPSNIHHLQEVAP